MCIVVFDSRNVKPVRGFAREHKPRRKAKATPAKSPKRPAAKATAGSAMKPVASKPAAKATAKPAVPKPHPAQAVPPKPHVPVPAPKVVPARPARPEGPTDEDRAWWAANSPANQRGYEVVGERRHRTDRKTSGELMVYRMYAPCPEWNPERVDRHAWEIQQLQAERPGRRR